MDKYVIKGGNPLVGEVEIGGAKNAALAILTAAIMTDEPVLVDNIPDVSDINVLLEAIAVIGARVDRKDRHSVEINGSTIESVSVDYEYIKKIRASYYLLGALLGKYKRAEVPLPDRSASEGIPRTRRKCGDQPRRHCGISGEPSRRTYLPGYGFCRRNDQYHDGGVDGKRQYDY